MRVDNFARGAYTAAGGLYQFEFEFEFKKFPARAKHPATIADNAI
jgi:hypothetical protein